MTPMVMYSTHTCRGVPCIGPKSQSNANGVKTTMQCVSGTSCMMILFEELIHVSLSCVSWGWHCWWHGTCAVYSPHVTTHHVTQMWRRLNPRYANNPTHSGTCVGVKESEKEALHHHKIPWVTYTMHAQYMRAATLPMLPCHLRPCGYLDDIEGCKHTCHAQEKWIGWWNPSATHENMIGWGGGYTTQCRAPPYLTTFHVTLSANCNQIKWNKNQYVCPIYTHGLVCYNGFRVFVKWTWYHGSYTPQCVCRMTMVTTFSWITFDPDEIITWNQNQ